MERVKVTRNYQITIPSSIREALEIKEGDILEISLKGDHIVVSKVVPRRPRVKLQKPLTIDYIEKSIERGINENLS
ncbi:AbrB family transcriptional regulator [Sulfolobus acidocaldarius SUSAZ]|nr:AbrB family transcriptional regulator [Sulfolobus acidocaldarius SUSAZ]